MPQIKTMAIDSRTISEKERSGIIDFGRRGKYMTNVAQVDRIIGFRKPPAMLVRIEKAMPYPA